jgi:hypothetical protein
VLSASMKETDARAVSLASPTNLNLLFPLIPLIHFSLYPFGAFPEQTENHLNTCLMSIFAFLEDMMIIVIVFLVSLGVVRLSPLGI